MENDRGFLEAIPDHRRRVARAKGRDDHAVRVLWGMLLVTLWKIPHCLEIPDGISPSRWSVPPPGLTLTERFWTTSATRSFRAEYSMNLANEPPPKQAIARHIQQAVDEVVSSSRNAKPPQWQSLDVAQCLSASTSDCPMSGCLFRSCRSSSHAYLGMLERSTGVAWRGPRGFNPDNRVLN